MVQSRSELSLMLADAHATPRPCEILGGLCAASAPGSAVPAFDPAPPLRQACEASWMLWQTLSTLWHTVVSRARFLPCTRGWAWEMLLNDLQPSRQTYKAHALSLLNVFHLLWHNRTASSACFCILLHLPSVQLLMLAFGATGHHAAARWWIDWRKTESTRDEDTMRHHDFCRCLASGCSAGSSLYQDSRWEMNCLISAYAKVGRPLEVGGA